MKKASGKAGSASVQECRCQRSACLKNYCRCYNANKMCGASCKCLGCKNVTSSGTRNPVVPIKKEPVEQRAFNGEMACSVTRVLMAKAFQLQSEGMTSANIEREVILEFNSCFLEVAYHLRGLSES